MTSVVHYEPYLDECGDLFTQRLLEFSKNGTSFDLGHWFQCFAFDAIAYVTYGQRMGFLDKGDDIENVIKNIDKGLVYSSLIGIFPVIHQFILPILIKLIPSIASSNAMSYVQDFTERQIIKARSSAKSNDPLDVDNEKGSTAQTFLSKFLARNSEAPDSFTDYHILIGCGMNMGAGSDTTGISLSAIMYYLLKNSDCMKRLQAEVDEVDRRGELSTNPSLKEGQKLPYLQAVIKEALRMHPATGLPMERIVPKGGATIAGRFFPAGVSAQKKS
jgi:cytochrome P450